jgi:hypothetical protein
VILRDEDYVLIPAPMVERRDFFQLGHAPVTAEERIAKEKQRDERNKLKQAHVDQQIENLGAEQQ